MQNGIYEACNGDEPIMAGCDLVRGPRREGGGRWQKRIGLRSEVTYLQFSSKS